MNWTITFYPKTTRTNLCWSIQELNLYNLLVYNRNEKTFRQCRNFKLIAKSWNKNLKVIKSYFLCSSKWINSNKCFKDYKLRSPYGLLHWFLIFKTVTCANLFQITFKMFDYLHKLHVGHHMATLIYSLVCSILRFLNFKMVDL